MFSIESSGPGQLLTVGFSEHVTAEEMARCRAGVEGHLTGLKTGFRMLTDLSGLISMEPACATALGEIMDLCSSHGVSAIHRVSPNPQKDIGFAIMSPFHYEREVQIVTHKETAAALKSLAGPSEGAN